MAQTTRNQRPRPSQRPQARGSGRGPGGGGGRPTGGGGGRGRQRGRQPAGFPWARVGIPALVVIAVAVILIVVSVGGGGKKTGGFGPPEASPAPSGVASAITQIPASVYDAVGMPASVVSAPTVLKGQPALTSNGKPEVFGVFEEWCPYCAAARWSLTAALARFGTFDNLKVTQSSNTDVYPDTNTLSFYHATYTSPTVTFRAVEEQNPVYQNIRGETLTAAESALEQKYNPQGSVPFIDVGNRYIISSTYNPQVLQGLSWGQIATELSNPKSTVTQNIVGAANFITAAICQITANAPASVCSSSGVKAAAAVLATVK